MGIKELSDEDVVKAANEEKVVETLVKTIVPPAVSCSFRFYKCVDHCPGWHCEVSVPGWTSKDVVVSDVAKLDLSVLARLWLAAVDVE